MTEIERYEVLKSTKLGEIISKEFETYLYSDGFFRAPASTKYTNVLWTHQADMLASHVAGV